jgi:hypothetical protein
MSPDGKILRTLLARVTVGNGKPVAIVVISDRI